MKQLLLPFLCWILYSTTSFAQFPWNNPLKMAWSNDGITFNNISIFQDSSGVPSVIKWKGDTLICAFQWFRQPNPSPSWDRVATKFSYDNGLTWTEPSPIIINGLPSNYQRAFDPTLTIFNNDSIRIYFSSSATPPVGGLDSTVNTYSAKSADGIHFTFEPNPRVDVLPNRVIDPAVIYFNNSWHYASPIGAPQQGAYHYVSPNGLNFSAVSSISSNSAHNWTGNYMVENSSELRFYGTGSFIWYNSTPNGGVWNGYVNTNILGGDPSVVKIANGNYLMIYVGQPYNTAVQKTASIQPDVQIYPNPTATDCTIEFPADFTLNKTSMTFYNSIGQAVATFSLENNPAKINLESLEAGLYFYEIKNGLTAAYSGKMFIAR